MTKQKGGDSSNRRYESISMKSYGYEHGSNPQSNAINYMKSQNETQNNMNNQLHQGGTKKRFHKGGNSSRRAASNDGIVVPQFASSGPNVSPVGGNYLSQATNTSLVTNQSNSQFDCYATGSCNQYGGNKKSLKRKSLKKKSLKKNPSKKNLSKKKSIKRKSLKRKSLKRNSLKKNISKKLTKK